MPAKTWKSRERQVAAFFGCRRTPLSGSNSGQTGSDTLHPRLFIEQKHRRRHAVLEVWRKAAERASQEGKLPLVTLTEHGKRGFWLLVYCDDMLDALEIVAESAEPNPQAPGGHLTAEGYRSRNRLTQRRLRPLQTGKGVTLWMSA